VSTAPHRKRWLVYILRYRDELLYLGIATVPLRWLDAHVTCKAKRSRSSTRSTGLKSSAPRRDAATEKPPRSAKPWLIRTPAEPHNLEARVAEERLE
jgi:predicted GIY-YIG superfamily endonuclease